MRFGKTLAASTLVLILCGILITLTTQLPLSVSLIEAITAEIVGGGILGVIVAAIFFYLEETNEYQANKEKAKSFYENKLILDILDVMERGPSIWNLGGLNKFYFDGSLINSLFDVYKANFNPINDYVAYYPSDELTNTYSRFYKLLRKGYISGEKLENLVRQYVRAEHHKLGVISPNDNSAVMYLKGKLFANLPDSELKKHLEWKDVPDRAKGFLDELTKNKDVNDLLIEIKNTRDSLLTLENKIVEITTEKSKKLNSN